MLSYKPSSQLNKLLSQNAPRNLTLEENRAGLGHKQTGSAWDCPIEVEDATPVKQEVHVLKILHSYCDGVPQFSIVLGKRQVAFEELAENSGGKCTKQKVKENFKETRRKRRMSVELNFRKKK